MKIISIVLSILALALIVFNFTKLDFNAPFKGDSMIAIITIISGLCVILLMTILRISKRIEEKTKARK